MEDTRKDWAVGTRRGFRESFPEEVTPDLGKGAGHTLGNARREDAMG